MGQVAITLVTSRFCDARPDLVVLHELEEDCLAHSTWKARRGPLLFPPVKVSTRFFTFLHSCLRPLLRGIETNRAVISLGLPYRHYFFGKTFPHFTFGARLRVLWLFDVWQPRFAEIAALVLEAQIDVLLVSSAQATEYFRNLRLPCCHVHWVPECVNVSHYPSRPWYERSIDVLAFGRSYSRYHEAIADQCRRCGIKYVFDRHPTVGDLRVALSEARISLCFPRSVTHPTEAGAISTVTLRYLESMAAKCLILGNAPADMAEMFGYQPVIEVDWTDPIGQIKNILANLSNYRELIERNFTEVSTTHDMRRFIARVERAIQDRCFGEAPKSSSIPRS
jgi:hypothetical protein